MRVWTLLFATAVILSFLCQTVTTQTSRKVVVTAPDTSKISLVFTGGFVMPLSKVSLTHFWKGGPGFSMKVMVRATPAVYFGVGVDVSGLWFRWARFAAAYPTVEVHRKDMAWSNLFMFSRYRAVTSFPAKPYAEFSIGASRLSGAEYKQIIDSVRVTYYDVPGRTRLAMTFTGGLEIPLSRRFSFLAEADLRYVHNDPNVGVGLLFLGGARIKL